MTSSINVQLGFDLRLVTTAVALADELHFATAARRLDLAPSAVSHQISRLEVQLGVTLFDRSTRRVELTDAGTAFVQHARSILRSAHRAVAEASAAAPKREVDIAVDIDVPDRLVRHLRRLGSSRPDLSFKVLPMQQREALDRTQAGTVDHCVVWSAAPSSLGLTVSELMSVAIWCVVPAASDLASSSPSVSVEDLEGERLVIYRPDSTTQAFYDEFLAALSSIDPVVDHVEGDDVQYEMCRQITSAGGFTITSEGDTAHLPHDVVAMPFSPPISTKLVLCSPAEADDTTRRPILQHFRSTPLRPTS